MLCISDLLGDLVDGYEVFFIQDAVSQGITKASEQDQKSNISTGFCVICLCVLSSKHKHLPLLQCSLQPISDSFLSGFFQRQSLRLLSLADSIAYILMIRPIL